MPSFLFGLILAASLPAAKTLDVYFVDVEGGQATLIVSPSGQSMMVDTGWPGFNNRDADRNRGSGQTGGREAGGLPGDHAFHTDHVGGVPQLAGEAADQAFVDHGENRGERRESRRALLGLQDRHGLGPAPRGEAGDKVPVKGLDVEVLTA